MYRKERYCQSQQHAVCFGLLVPAAEHCCSACAERDPSRSPTCGYLKGVGPRKQECLCIFRRSLVICSRQTTVTGEQLMGKFNLTAASTSKMLRLMQSHHIVPPDVDPALLSIARPIDPMGLKLAYKRFFRLEQDTIPDRVIAETEASDPVEEALSPIEKMSLKDTNLGSVIQKPVSQPTPLKEFSEVELPSKDTSEDLPLSGSHNPIKIPRAERKRKQDDEDWTPNKLPRLRSGASKKKK
ncbi:uncharacterized protein LOC125240187 [Leguminivora glycinivorella]|uniref:uncharacterized protein LOC125240187 n=1 Tax=Leguminivora glycinivorella TaxID=1035111 RepID=UPI00200E87AE|nr:uncharacterized protein LOC125240187 [Leguminivora glycinivorella]